MKNSNNEDLRNKRASSINKKLSSNSESWGQKICSDEQVGEGPVPSNCKTAIIIFRISDRRRRDIDNMVNTIFDALVASGEITDDGLDQIGTLFATHTRVTKGGEGATVILT